MSTTLPLNPSSLLPILGTQDNLPLMAWRAQRVTVPAGQTINSGLLQAYARSAVLACPSTNPAALSAGPTQDTADGINLDPGAGFSLDSGSQIRYRLDDWWFKNANAADGVIIVIWI